MGRRPVERSVPTDTTPKRVEHQKLGTRINNASDLSLEPNQSTKMNGIGDPGWWLLSSADEPLDILCNLIELQIHAVANHLLSEIRMLQRVRDDPGTEEVVFWTDDR